MSDQLNYSIDKISRTVNELSRAPKGENSLHKEFFFDPLCAAMEELAQNVGMLSEQFQQLSVQVQELQADLEKEKNDKSSRTRSKKAEPAA